MGYFLGSWYPQECLTRRACDQCQQDTVCQYPAFDNYSYGSTQVNIFVHNYWCGIAMFLQSNPCGCGAYCQI